MTSEPLPDELELEDIRIASPCPMEWAAMEGDDRVRHCGECDKQVFNLASMTRAEATELVRTRTRSLCVQLHRRADGRVMTSDCPVGRRQRRMNWALAGAGLLLAVVVYGLSRVRSPATSRSPWPATPTLDDAKDWVSHCFGVDDWCNCRFYLGGLF